MTSAFIGDDIKLQATLEKGAEINVKGPEEMTALMVASIGGHAACVKLLLDNGADVNVEDKKGRTALMMVEALLRSSQAKAEHVLIRKLLQKPTDSSKCEICGKELRGPSGGTVIFKQPASFDFLGGLLAMDRYVCSNCHSIACYKCLEDMVVVSDPPGAKFGPNHMNADDVEELCNTAK